MEKKDKFIEWSLADKLKYLVGTVAIVLAVYLGFRYLFGIVWPFLIAYVVALAIEKPVNGLAKLFKGKKGISATVIVIILTAVIFTVLGYILYMGFMEIKTFLGQFDYYMIGIRQQAVRLCFNMDSLLGLHYGCTLGCMEAVLSKAGELFHGENSGQLMNLAEKIFFGSLPILTRSILVIGAVIISFISVVYLSSVLDQVRRWRMKSVFREEVCVVTAALNRLLSVYFGIQLCIMAINGALCVAALLFIQNPYAVVLGILIGLVDALPFFGTGTVLLPWALFAMLMQNWKTAVVLITVYLLTYFVREIMESKCMGDRLGISSFTMLMVIFVGIMVYGLLGFILGPISYVMIKALVQYLKTVLERDRLNSV